jgi:hypothetical protein
MHGLPDDFEPERFVGKTLDTVTFAAYTVHFRFADGDWVSTEVSFTFRNETDDPVTDQALPVRSSTVMRLVGARVAAASSSREGRLTLHFEGGGLLEFHDDGPRYESYHVRLGGDELHV